MSDSSSRNDDNSHEQGVGKRVAEPTIVGGRPLGRSRSLQGIPRGIEVLIKKASVDPDFRSVLLEKRSEAAAEIELELSPTEAAMLNAIPAAQIEKIIESAKVPNEHRRVFLGNVAAAMLAMLSIPLPVNAWEFAMKGHVSGEGPLPPLSKRPTLESLGFLGGGYRLQCNIVAEAANWLSGRVHYICPFVKGQIEILFRSRYSAEKADVACELSQSIVSGRGEVTFWAHGKDIETHQILIGLRDIQYSEKHEFELLSQCPPPGYLPGVYQVDGLIWRIVKYVKVWSAE